MLNNTKVCCSAGSGTPVIMLHSSMSSKEQWYKLLTDLEGQYNTIAIDLLGYGAEQFPDNPESFTLEREARRIKQIVEKVSGERRYHLVGHSYGGATALKLAHLDRNSILSLSLFEPVAFHLLDKQDSLLQEVQAIAGEIARLIVDRSSSEATQLFVDFWSGGGTYSVLSAKRKRHLDLLIPKVVLDFQAGINEPLSLSDYRELNLPICLLGGRTSRAVTQKITTSLNEVIPGGELHWVDGGHMSPVTEAENVNRIIKDFLNRQG